MTEPSATSEILPVSLFPSLRTMVETAGLNPYKLRLAIKSDGQGRLFVERHTLGVTDGDTIVVWAVPTLTELFRGDKAPPADLDHYPPEYMPYFYFIERHLVELSNTIGDRTDQEMEEIYAALRRRPDSRSLSLTHDFVWQAAALLLGSYVLSGDEFEGMMGTLVRSTRRWAMRPISRFYTAYLRKEFGSVAA